MPSEVAPGALQPHFPPRGHRCAHRSGAALLLRRAEHVPALPATRPRQPTDAPAARQGAVCGGNTMAELVELMPTAQGEAAPVLKVLKERTETMYHFCIEIDHLEEALAELQQRHMRDVAAPCGARV